MERRAARAALAATTAGRMVVVTAVVRVAAAESAGVKGIDGFFSRHRQPQKSSQLRGREPVEPFANVLAILKGGEQDVTLHSNRCLRHP